MKFLFYYLIIFLFTSCSSKSLLNTLQKYKNQDDNITMNNIEDIKEKSENISYTILNENVNYTEPFFIFVWILAMVLFFGFTSVSISIFKKINSKIFKR